MAATGEDWLCARLLREGGGSGSVVMMGTQLACLRAAILSAILPKI